MDPIIVVIDRYCTYSTVDLLYALTIISIIYYTVIYVLYYCIITRSRVVESHSMYNTNKYGMKN